MSFLGNIVYNRKSRRKRDEMRKIKKINFQPKIFSPKVGAVLLGLVVCLLIVYWQKPSKALVNQYQVALDQLQSETKGLDKNAKQEDLDHLAAIVNQMPLVGGLPFKKKYVTFQRAFDELQNARSIFQTNQGDNKLLRADLDRKELEGKLKACQGKEANSPACQIYQEGMDILQSIDEAQAVVQNRDLNIKVRGDIEPGLKEYLKFEARYRDLANQPQAESLRQTLQSKADRLAEIILKGAQYGDYSAEFKENLKESPFLKIALRASEFDQEPLASLTFDDGPNPEYTPWLLDVLKKHGVKATFFLVGGNVDKYPELTKRIYDEGHIIGNHTYNHPDLRKCSDEEVLKQFEWTQMAIKAACGFEPNLYRLPFGAGGKRVVDLMAKQGMTSILWNIDTMDWSSHNTQAILNEVDRSLQHHSLILMHDSHPATPEAVDQLIPKLKELGYAFVGPDELSFKLRYFAE